jgi:hypothetical protein
LFRISSTTPSRFSSSMLRALMKSIFGCADGVAERSTITLRTPCRANSSASVAPTGPAPTIRTGVTT